MSLLVLLAAATVGVAEALLELLHAPRGVDEALLTREERVVAGPDVNVDLGFGAVGFHHQLAVAVDLGGHHLRVNILLHKASLQDRKSTRLNSSHVAISYAVFCWNKRN